MPDADLGMGAIGFEAVKFVPWAYIPIRDILACVAKDEGFNILLEVNGHQAW